MDADAAKIPSFTSYAVAKGYYAMGRRRPGLLVDARSLEAINSILKKVEKYPKYKKLSYLPNCIIPKIVDTLGLRGLSLHYVLRKNFIEKKLRDFLAAGHKQVVIIGGGLDTLGVRIANEFASLLVVEIDQAATQIVKQDLAANAKSKIIFNSSNLEEKPLAEILGGINEFDSAKPTFFVCEGVLMYLTQQTVEGIFNYISGFPAEAYFAFTALEDAEGIKNDRQYNFMRKLVKSQNEPFISGLGGKVLANIPNIRVLEKITYRELQAPHRKPRYLAKLSEYSEYICFINKP